MPKRQINLELRFSSSQSKTKTCRLPSKCMDGLPPQRVSRQICINLIKYIGRCLPVMLPRSSGMGLVITNKTSANLKSA